MKPVFITTPIYYVNDSPHIGHAYTTLACDTWARFKRLQGHAVNMVTGTDEHGQKIQTTAERCQQSPRDFADKVSQTFRNLLTTMDVAPDDFIRTTEPRHYKAVHGLWNRLVERGQIYLGSYKGWYSVRDEAFLTESDFINGEPPQGAVWVEEPSYFFKLSEWTEPLLKFYRENPHFVYPETRFREVIRFVEGGLTDLSVSRTSFQWGIPVPNDPSHVIYVWLDALTNYITTLGYPEDTEDMKTLWPEAIHVVGKDILRFHAVYWPAFLMAAGLPLPQKVVAHGWWTVEGQKMSKSLGNTVDPVELIKTFGIDEVRYFLLREVPFGQDGDFSRSSLIRRINSDLANTYGNLVQRVLAFVSRQLDGKIPHPHTLTAEDKEFLDLPKDVLNHSAQECENFAFHRYSEEVWGVLFRANQYMDEMKPWSLKKTDLERMETVIYVLLEAIRRIALLTSPILPKASAKIFTMLGYPEGNHSFGEMDTPLTPGTSILEPTPLFQKWDEV